MADYTDIPMPKEMNKKIGNAWRKGYAAFLNEKTKRDCPYTRARMSMAYCRAWDTGWETAKGVAAQGP